LRGGRAETQDYLRPHRVYLRDEPWSACDNLGATGLLVYPPFAVPAGELEMLHGIGLVCHPWIDAGLVERPGKQTTRRTDERQTCAILLVARLLTDQHDRRSGWSMTEDRLGGVLEKRAAPATLGRRFQ
jgi:hypothetical protein